MCCWVFIFGPPQFMLVYLKKDKRSKDVQRCVQKNIQNKAVQTNSNLYINNTCNETF